MLKVIPPSRIEYSGKNDIGFLRVAGASSGKARRLNFLFYQ